MAADLISARAVVRMLRSCSKTLRDYANERSSNALHRDKLLACALAVDLCAPEVRRMVARARKRKAKRDG